MDYRVGVTCIQGSGQGRTGLGKDGDESQSTGPKASKQPTQEKERGSVSTWSNQNRHLKETNQVRARLGVGQSEQAQRARAAPIRVVASNK